MSDHERALAPVVVRIEVPRWSFVKRQEGQGIEYVSPLPSPFNYGFVEDSLAADGEPQDALVLGRRLGSGTRVLALPRLRVRFLDEGLVDDKLVCADHEPTTLELLSLRAFFRVYALARALLNRLQGRRGRTAYLGLERAL